MAPAATKVCRANPVLATGSARDPGPVWVCEKTLCRVEMTLRKRVAQGSRRRCTGSARDPGPVWVYNGFNFCSLKAAMPKPKVKVEKLQKIYEDMKAYVKRYKDEVPPDRPGNSKLRVFSDCAGIGSEAIALNPLGLSQQVILVGGSEADDFKRIMMETVHEKSLVETGTPEAFSKDIFKRKPQDCPACDIYLAGYPCPASLSLGKRFGLRDGKKRGLPMVAGLRYSAQDACHTSA
eukprot:s554_g28.t1